MTDREKTIKWLECCGNYDEKLQHVGCSSACPYWENADMCDPVQPFSDALKLLKEQEPVKPIKSKLSFTHGFNWDIWDCGCCGNQLRSFAKYCDQCGQAVKWE